MIPLYEGPAFVFRFADHRLIDRVHLDGVPAGTLVTVRDLDDGGVLATATVGHGGWVSLDPPLVVGPRGGFMVTRDG